MHRTIYSEIALETTGELRAREREAFDRSIQLLEIADREGPSSSEAIAALHYLGSLWKVLMEDLSAEGNGLPQELRASLISIGIWMLRRAEEIRSGKCGDFRALIEVSRSIRKGLGER